MSQPKEVVRAFHSYLIDLKLDARNNTISLLVVGSWKHSVWKSYLSPLIYTKGHKENRCNHSFISAGQQPTNTGGKRRVSIKRTHTPLGSKKNVCSWWLSAQDMLDSKLWTLWFFLLVCRGKSWKKNKHLGTLESRKIRKDMNAGGKLQSSQLAEGSIEGSLHGFYLFYSGWCCCFYFLFN